MLNGLLRRNLLAPSEPAPLLVAHDSCTLASSFRPKTHPPRITESFLTALFLLCPTSKCHGVFLQNISRTERLLAHPLLSFWPKTLDRVMNSLVTCIFASVFASLISRLNSARLRLRDSVKLWVCLIPALFRSNQWLLILLSIKIEVPTGAFKNLSGQTVHTPPPPPYFRLHLFYSPACSFCSCHTDFLVVPWVSQTAWYMPTTGPLHLQLPVRGRHFHQILSLV